MPTLARLSFFVPPAQLDDFAPLYDRYLLPLLQPHGLESGLSDDRPSVAGVFSRLFAVESPTVLIHTQHALRLDPTWQHALKALEGRLGAGIRHDLTIYSTPATEGKVVHAGPGLRQGQWHSFGVADGLGSPLIAALLWDPSGKLWIGTWDGLSCFDGAQFTNYTMADGIPGPRVRSLLQDRKGHLWVGTGGFIDGFGWGVCRFDGQEWVTYTKADGLAGNWISALAEDHQGRIWLATHQGVSCFDGKHVQTYTTQDGLAHDYNWSLLVDRQGVLWAGAWYGLSRFDGARFQQVPLPLGTPTCSVEKVFALMEDRQGVLWLGLSEGVGCWDGKEFTRLSQDGEGKHLVEDRQDQVWWGAYARGVRCRDGTKIRRYDTANGLSNDQAVPLALDGAGQVWVGTQGGGICRFEGARFFTLTKHEGLADNGLYTMYEDAQARLWVGTYQGVCCYDGEGFTSLTLDSGTDQWRNLALAIHQDRQGALWFVSFRGDVKCYDGQEVETLHQGEASRSHIHTSRAIVEDAQGRLWFALSEPGVKCYEQGQWRTYTQADGLVDDDVRTLGLDRQGNVWVVTGSGGVNRWDGQQFHTVTTGEGLGFAPGRVVREDRQGNIWFATDGGGVSCWDGKQFTRYTMAQGLAYDRVFALMEDERGRLWFGTQGGGVSIFDGQVFQTLSTQDGLVNDVVQEIVRTRQGQIWIATEGGITRYTPTTQAPGVRLRQVAADRAYAPDESISISSGQTRVSFAFQGRSFTSRPDRLVYRYRLEAHDVDWRVTRETSVDYLYLPLGEYTFEVQAVDADLNYSVLATVKLEVVPDPKVEALEAAVSTMKVSGEYVGTSPALQQVKESLHQVAQTDLTVLIQGETGTGKGLAAQIVHAWSAREAALYIKVNCATLPPGLEESELFGHEKGAFTGAAQRKSGWVEVAQGGTLFLDEIGELPLSTQAKLLQLVEERTFSRLGSTQTLQSTARVIAATNRDLEAMVREGTFRQDLYYRLRVYPVRLPPLRERREDIPELARHFLAMAANHLGRQVPALSPEVLRVMGDYSWPGNVRELQHTMSLAVMACKGLQVQVGDIAQGGSTPPEPAPHSANGNGRVYLIEEVERRHIREVLEETGWLIQGERGAAALLGLAPSTLRSRMQKLGIRRG